MGSREGAVLLGKPSWRFEARVIRDEAPLARQVLNTGREEPHVLETAGLVVGDAEEDRGRGSAGLRQCFQSRSHNAEDVVVDSSSCLFRLPCDFHYKASGRQVETFDSADDVLPVRASEAGGFKCLWEVA